MAGLPCEWQGLIMDSDSDYLVYLVVTLGSAPTEQDLQAVTVGPGGPVEVCLLEKSQNVTSATGTVGCNEAYSLNGAFRTSCWDFHNKCGSAVWAHKAHFLREEKNLQPD